MVEPTSLLTMKSICTNVALPVPAFTPEDADSGTHTNTQTRVYIYHVGTFLRMRHDFGY